MIFKLILFIIYIIVGLINLLLTVLCVPLYFLMIIRVAVQGVANGTLNERITDEDTNKMSAVIWDYVRRYIIGLDILDRFMDYVDSKLGITAKLDEIDKKNEDDDKED